MSKASPAQQAQRDKFKAMINGKKGSNICPKCGRPNCDGSCDQKGKKPKKTSKGK